jgi:aminoglycoside phosphotransferase (APT) family kinase protein
VHEGGVLLADLHQRLHVLPPMAGAAGSVLHLDLHPDNVLMSPRGPVVIDWSNATHGDPDVDIAMTWLILEPFVGMIDGVEVFIDAFLGAAGRDDAVAGLARAGEQRLADPNLTDHEAEVVRALLNRP